MGTKAANACNRDAVVAVRLAMVEVPMVSTSVIGAGERDEAPMLHDR
jgi:fructose-1,6-bisphosphatase/sedoheptulose 1,7-bisphosphatase-like protein